MWSSVVLFILTFAVLGLLLGVAAVSHTVPQGKKENLTIKENITANATHGNQSVSNLEKSGK